MNKIIDQIVGWDFLQQLPAEYSGFTLDAELAEHGSRYAIFTYDRPKDRRRFSVLYDNATRDFLARVTVGLMEYYDVSFITTSLASLEQALAMRLKKTLDWIAAPAEQGYESIFTAKKIIEWTYAQELPLKYAGFSLFISPRQPVKIINGSYIILDYSDFACESNLNVYYNVYRDEFFGEQRLRLTPKMTSNFDARELNELAEKLSTNLRPTLQELRAEIG